MPYKNLKKRKEYAREYMRQYRKREEVKEKTKKYLYIDKERFI